MSRRQGNLLTQRISDFLGAVLPWRLLHQNNRKSLAWRQMMTELSLWMENFIPSRYSHRKKFILGSYLKCFGVITGRKIWGCHSSCMRRTRTGGRRKKNAQPWRLPQLRLITSRRRRMIQAKCSVTLHSQPELPQLNFNRTLPQLHRPSQMIPILKTSSLPQVLGCKCRRP